MSEVIKSTVAEFNITYTQFLDESGKPSQDLPSIAKDFDKLIKLYRFMVFLRAFDTKAINLQRTGKLGTYAAILGQEAVGTVIGELMQKEDILAPAYREYGIQLQRGMKIQDILNFWGGDERGNNFANPHDFSMCVPIASQCLHAAGAAKAVQIRKEKRVVVAVCGDGATSEGDFYEAMNVAGTWKLPLVFIVCNNQWAISVPRHVQSAAGTLAQKAIAAGIPSEQVDGNDVIAMHEVVEQALDRARNGDGPYVIEAITYRLHDHTTADDATRYRSQEEVDQAWQREPIKRIHNYLVANNKWNDDLETKLQEEMKAHVAEELEGYFNMPKPKATDMFEHMYETLPDALLEQYEIVSQG